MGAICEICEHPVGEQAYVCAACAGGMLAALRAVHGDAHLHGLDTDLDIAIARQGTRLPDTGAKRTKTASQIITEDITLPQALAMGGVDPRASEAAQVLRGTLSTWCRVLIDEDGGHPPTGTLASMARWLGERTETIRHRAWAPECVDEVLAAVAQARRAVDRPPERVYAGECPQCSAPVYGVKGRDTADCRREGCDGIIEDPDARRADAAREAARLAPDREVTAVEAALVATAMGQRVTDRWIRRLDQMGRLARWTRRRIRAGTGWGTCWPR
ncbi:hypothetical protein CDO52_12880 [Nocardiopsis gilva YIM 90087]|uniref:Uncharacterized protein n=1 Tax=Nocardiopsis gilva YIM 90087 TaxID=1235441 RepID=A0A223S5Y0_9ACTN|nr:hypothetical protein [Nocardiopsis gilva]ASU83563.1 hypothetical protein CDO52_12880 [Nocardiopsis gilva YIM 90087]